jgi:hypothetical protein
MEIYDTNPDHIRLDIGVCPWVNVADVEVVTVEAIKAPETITRVVKRPVRIGDTIRGLFSGKTYKVTDVKSCDKCGGTGMVVNTGDFMHDWAYEIIETVPMWEQRPAKAGDTIRVLKGRANGAPVEQGETLKVKSLIGDRGSVDAESIRGRLWSISLENYEVKNV